MAASAGEVELVDLSAADDEPGPPRGPRRRVRARTAALVAVLVVVGSVAAGAWQHRSAVAAQRAAAAAAAQEQRWDEGRARANALEQRLWQVRSASRAVTAAVTPTPVPTSTGPEAGPESTAGPPATDVGPVWGPADLGPQAARADDPLDLQVVGVWPQAPGTSAVSAGQRIGYRLITGLPESSGKTPCQVPAVRITDWSWEDGGDAALACRVLAAGARGTAAREGSSGTGTGAKQVREVVLVSGGRAASVAVWSTGGAPLPLDGPALGAAAAALLTSTGSS